jgi:hypothetical protein
MCVSKLAAFIRIQRGMDPPEDHRGAARTRRAADLVATQRIAGVDADADDVTTLDRARVEPFEHLVGQPRHTVLARRRAGEDEQPSRRDHRNAKRLIRWIHEMHGHGHARWAEPRPLSSG